MSFFTKDETYTDRYGDAHTKRVVRKGRVIATAAVAICLIVLIFGSWTIIPSGYTGVRTTFGQINQQPVAPGFAWKIPLVQSIQKVNNKQQEQSFAESDGKHPEYIWAESSERTEVYMEDITVTYKINPEYSAWLFANVNDYRNNALPQTLVASSLKAAAVQLPSADVTNRSKIEPIAVQMLQDALNTKYNKNEVIQVINVNIGQMDFEDSYNAAIANKQVSQINYEQQQIVNRQAIEAQNAEAEKVKIAAQAEADQKLIAAQAEAEERRIKADAEADAIKAVADAQAEANEKLSKSISDTLIGYDTVHQWNGEMPVVVGSNGTLLDIGDLLNG